MDYAAYVNALAATWDISQDVVDATSPTPFDNADYNTALPRCIEFAELLMYRDPDFDFLATRLPIPPYTVCIANSRIITKPAQIVVCEQMNIITPVGSIPGASGSARNPLTRVSLPFMDNVWPTESGVPGATGVPEYFALLDNTKYRLAPTPDQPYFAEFVGTYRPSPLSSTNTQTFLTIYLPDLFLIASNVWWAGFQRDYGAQADDPKVAISWSSLYQNSKKGAAVEEARKKAQSTAWEPYVPTPLATPRT